MVVRETITGIPGRGVDGLEEPSLNLNDWKSDKGISLTFIPAGKENAF